MIPVVYNYHCACGYHYAAQEQVQVGAYIRLLINSVVLCSECKQPLQPQVQVVYASSPATDEREEEDAKQ
jgi:predicted SprT family Zn-dependent metalloprotease